MIFGKKFSNRLKFNFDLWLTGDGTDDDEMDSSSLTVHNKPSAKGRL
jgi:hypothetical protein